MQPPVIFWVPGLAVAIGGILWQVRSGKPPRTYWMFIAAGLVFVSGGIFMSIGRDRIGSAMLGAGALAAGASVLLDLRGWIELNQRTSGRISKAHASAKGSRQILLITSAAFVLFGTGFLINSALMS